MTTVVVILEELRELDRRALGWVGKPGAYEAVVAEIFARPEEPVRGCEAAGFAVGRSRAPGIWRGIGFPDVAVVDPIRKQVLRPFGAAVAS